MALSLRKFWFSPGVFSLLKNIPPVLPHQPANYPKRQFSSVKPQIQEIVKDYSKADDEMCKKVFAKVNEQIANKSHGRLFAVVHIQGTQFKITQEDIIILRHRFGPTLGDVIRLEKVLLVGSSDFTLIGRPLLPLDQVSVIATVFEKTLSHTIPYCVYTPRKNNLRQHFFKDELTYLRINSIDLTGKVNELGETDGFKDRIF